MFIIIIFYIHIMKLFSVFGSGESLINKLIEKKNQESSYEHKI